MFLAYLYNYLTTLFHFNFVFFFLSLGKGGKNRRRGKNENETEKRELVFKEDGQGNNILSNIHYNMMHVLILK